MMQVRLVPGSLQRVCQLTGEYDRTKGGPVPSCTVSTAKLVGTDLGSSVDLGDRLVFMFGDTWPDPGLGDTVAWTTATEPDANLRLTFATDPSGRFRTFVLQDRFVPSGRGGTGVFEVPTGGFANEGRLYVVYSQGHYERGPTMLSSVMCRADDPNDLSQLTVLYEVSRLCDGRFINAAPVVHRSRRNTPWMVYFWGSSDYRKSHVYLARVPLTEIDEPQKSGWRYWTGQGWSEHEQDTAPLFEDQPPGVGELSAAWIAPLRRWLLTYQLDNPRGVWYRTAQNPTGPYSAAQLLYHPDWPGVGYGSVMHRGWDAGGVMGTDMLYDLGRGEEWGGEYGPYIVSRFTRADGPNRARIAFTLSTWNPYQAHLFIATLGLSDASLQAEPALQPPFAAHQPPPTHPQGVSMLVSTFGPGNFELAAPGASGGMLLRSRENTRPGLPWDGVARIGLGPRGEADPVHYGAVCMLQSDLPNRPGDHNWMGRLYLAARCGDRVVYLWREAAPPWEWRGPFPVIAVEPDDRRVSFADAAGNVALIRSHHGAKQRNWELVSPAAHGGGVLHFWRDNTADFPLHDDWRLAPRFLQGLGTVDAVTMIESQLTGVFALEVVVRVGPQLWFARRNAALQWVGPFPLEVDGHAVVEASGVPSLIQSGYGAKGRNFELVTPRAQGGLLHLWRNNDSDDAPDGRWGRAASLIDPTGHYRSVSLLQGAFGPKPGNLELVVRRDDDRVMHFWREAASLQWQGPFDVL